MKGKLFLLVLLTVLLSGAVSAVPIVSYFFNTTIGSDIEIVENDIVRDSSAIFQVITDREVDCRYSLSEGVSYESMTGNFDFSFGTIHNKEILDLEDGVYHYYVKCKDESDAVSNELDAVFSVITPVTAQVILSDESPIKAGVIDVSLITSKVVQEVPSLSYSFNGVSYIPIPLSGSGTSWIGHVIISESQGEVVGSFKFSGLDLEGQQGKEITNGGIFLVDSVKPKTIINFDATGHKGRINLDWYIDDDDDIDFYNIYRSKSPSPSFSDFYKKIDLASEDSFSDTLVDSGETYYYRITAVDKAGNEGDLSIEVFATALINEINNTKQGGLPLELHGFVDNSVVSIDLLIEDVENSRDSFELEDDKINKIFEDLGFGSEISSVISELNALKNDVSRYKTQILTQNELEKKLNSAEVKMNSIRKRVPDSIIVVEEKSGVGAINEEDIRKVVLDFNNGLLDERDEERIEKTLGALERLDFAVSRDSYNLDVIFLDGTKKETSLIREKIESGGINDSFSIVAFIPKEVAGSVSEIDVRKGDYQVLKEDPILSFSHDTLEIIYVLDSFTSLGRIDEIKVFPFHNEVLLPDSRGFSITGYSIFSGIGARGYFGLIAGILVIAALGIYFYFVREKANYLVRTKEIREKIEKTKKEVDDSKLDSAHKGYSAISLKYKELRGKDKKRIYPEMEELSARLSASVLKDKFAEVLNLYRVDKYRAKEEFKRLEEIFDKAPEKLKKELEKEWQDLSEVLRNVI